MGAGAGGGGLAGLDWEPSLVLGETGGVWAIRAGLVETEIGAPGRANFSGLEMPHPEKLS